MCFFVLWTATVDREGGLRQLRQLTYPIGPTIELSTAHRVWMRVIHDKRGLSHTNWMRKSFPQGGGDEHRPPGKVKGQMRKTSSLLCF